MRLLALALATIALLTSAFAETIPVIGQDMYTLLYLWGEGDFAVLDTSESDTVWSVRDSTRPLWTHQRKFVAFPLPTTVADCDCLYIVVRAYNLSLNPWHGQTGISMYLFPQDSTDTTGFSFHPLEYWSHFYTLDSIPYGALYSHRTMEGHDVYFQWTLNRDYPAADEIIMAIAPVDVGDCHLVVDATMYWTTDAVSVPPRGERSPPPQVTIYPNPASDGFSYQGPESRYRLFNLLGQTVSEGTVRPGLWIPMAPHPPGTYFLLIEAREARQTITIRKLR